MEFLVQGHMGLVTKEEKRMGILKKQKLTQGTHIVVHGPCKLREQNKEGEKGTKIDTSQPCGLAHDLYNLLSLKKN